MLLTRPAKPLALAGPAGGGNHSAGTGPHAAGRAAEGEWVAVYGAALAVALRPELWVGLMPAVRFALGEAWPGLRGLDAPVRRAVRFVPGPPPGPVRGSPRHLRQAVAHPAELPRPPPCWQKDEELARLELELAAVAAERDQLRMHVGCGALAAAAASAPARVRQLPRHRSAAPLMAPAVPETRPLPGAAAVADSPFASILPFALNME